MKLTKRNDFAAVTSGAGAPGGLVLMVRLLIKRLESRFPAVKRVGANVRVDRPGLGTGRPEGLPHVAPIERDATSTDEKIPRWWRSVRLISGLSNPPSLGEVTTAYNDVRGSARAFVLLLAKWLQ